MSKLNVRWFAVMICTAVFAGFVAYPLGIRSALAEEHHNPRIHHAIAALRDAEDEINSAGHDFHGEKRAAVEAIHNALEHLDRIKDWDH